MYWKKFFKAAVIRMAHTMAQAALAVIGTGAVLADVDWRYVVSAAALAGIISLLKSLAVGLPEVEREDEITYYNDEEDL